MEVLLQELGDDICVNALYILQAILSPTKPGNPDCTPSIQFDKPDVRLYGSFFFFKCTQNDKTLA